MNNVYLLNFSQERFKIFKQIFGKTGGKVFSGIFNIVTNYIKHGVIHMKELCLNIY